MYKPLHAASVFLFATVSTFAVFTDHNLSYQWMVFVPCLMSNNYVVISLRLLPDSMCVNLRFHSQCVVMLLQTVSWSGQVLLRLYSKAKLFYT